MNQMAASTFYFQGQQKSLLLNMHGIYIFVHVADQPTDFCSAPVYPSKGITFGKYPLYKDLHETFAN